MQEKDTPNSRSLHVSYHGRRNAFTDSLGTTTSPVDHHPLRRMAEQSDGTFDVTPFHGVQVTDEYGNVLSAAHVISRIQKSFAVNSSHGMIIKVASAMRFQDRSHVGKISTRNFIDLISQYRLSASEIETKLLCKAFVADDGAINYERFLKSICKELAGSRRDTVERAFDAIEQRCGRNGVVQLGDACRVYNANADVRVQRGDMTPAQAASEFARSFSDSSSGDSITRQAFREYYSFISSTIPDDNVFNLLVWNTWITRGRR